MFRNDLLIIDIISIFFLILILLNQSIELNGLEVLAKAKSSLYNFQLTSRVFENVF